MEVHSQAFVPNIPFEDIQAYYRERYAIVREDGIVEVCMHTDGGSPSWDPRRHLEWADVIRALAADAANEVIILTGAGDKFEQGMDPAFLAELGKMAVQDPDALSKLQYDFVWEQERYYKTILTDVDVPIIAAIPAAGGEGGHMEFMLLADLRICAPDVVFKDDHFLHNSVPGGGAFAIYQRLIGEKRANYLAYTGASLDAQEALELGLVDEVVERGSLRERAWELARQIMRQSRATRRLTHELMRRPLRDDLSSAFFYGNVEETLAGMMAKSDFY